jgi:hypothetical protein
MKIERNNGATVLGKTIDVSSAGFGLAHYGSIGKRGEEITVTMNSDCEYIYKVEIVWSQEVPNQNGLYRSGIKILKRASQFSESESSAVAAASLSEGEVAEHYPIPSEEDAISLVPSDCDCDRDERGAKRIPLYSPASIVCKNGATVLGRARNISNYGIGLMHSPSIGNVGDSIIVTMNSSTKQYRFVYTIQWQKKIAYSPFWISGSSFTTRLNDASDILKSSEKIRTTIQKVTGQLPEDDHDFIGEINGDTITINTGINRAMRFDEMLPISYQIDNDRNFYSALVQMTSIRRIENTRIEIIGILSGIAINN